MVTPYQGMQVVPQGARMWPQAQAWTGAASTTAAGTGSDTLWLLLGIAVLFALLLPWRLEAGVAGGVGDVEGTIAGGIAG